MRASRSDEATPTAAQSTTCPNCSATRKPHNRRKRCLVVHIDGRGVRFTCFHCGWFKARFYDEGDWHVAKASALKRARIVARERAKHSERTCGRDGRGNEGGAPGVRVYAQRSVVVPEGPQRDPR